MKERDIIHGFRVTRSRKLDELGGTLWELTHIKTGAELVWLDNGESNKLFSIAFQTLPTDDTGVFHILEHSVLCGSERYPVKDPFVQLMKSSMKTFLNAMTFPDKTVYPVSSRNEADFLNLVRIYLDAVFHPAIEHNPYIFMQEGWHYELRDEAEIPVYKGVVFNEMKGAYSSVDTRLQCGLNRLMFPDSCYRFVSGGDPEKIPNLTYEAFLEKHRSCYHPSNAKIYLDGSVPLERTLLLLDEEYLSGYDRVKPPVSLTLQPLVSATEEVEYYEVSQEEDEAGAAHMAMGKVVCDWSDRKQILALTALSNYLTQSNDAPLTRAVLMSGLGQDAILRVEDGIAQPYICIWVKNTDYERREELKTVIRGTLEALLDRGLDRLELEGALNQLEFLLRESGEPKGLANNFNALNSWMYGGDPALCMTCSDLFSELRDELDTGYYEELLKKALLDEEHTNVVYLLPSKTKGEEDRQKEAARLAEAKATWSPQELKEVMDLNSRLDVWQAQENTPEALATLPTLPISEISREPERIGLCETTLEGIPVLFHADNCRGVVHFNLYFSLADQPLERMSALSFMTELMGLLPTRQHTVSELQRDIKLNIGSIMYNVDLFSPPGKNGVCRPFFTVSCSVLEDKLPAALRLISEILTETVPDGAEGTEMTRAILMQTNEMLRQFIMMDGNSYALQRALSHSSLRGAAREQANGYECYRWLNNFIQDFDEQIGSFQTLVKTMQKEVFVRERLTLSVTASEPHEEFEEFIRSLPWGDRQEIPQAMEAEVWPEAARETIRIPAPISYAAAGSHLKQGEEQYTAALQVLSTILSFDYLWNEIRVQGGAYGCGFQVDKEGNAGFYSYRDPDPVNSQQVFACAADFVRRFCESGQPLDGFIISTIASEEPLLTPQEKGAFADEDYFKGITYEDRVRIRQEMLALKNEDLLACCNLLERMAAENSRCIVGDADALESCDREGWDALRL